MMPRDDDLVAYLAGDGGGPLSPEEIADLDELRAVLADTSTWSEPPPELEDLVVAAIVAEARQAPPVVDLTAVRESRRRRAVGLGAAILAAAAAVLAFAVFGPDRNQPDFSMSLQATELAPGATGHVDLTKTQSGWRVELDATGLPRLDNGQFYEAWLKSDTNLLVPIGTFNEGKKVTLWAGVPVTEYKTLTVTIEATDNEQASSGKRVLVGTVTP
jgi:hypothetical protein